MQENSFSYRLKIEYSIQNGKAKIVRCWGAYEEISLPPVLEGCPVTEIGPYAFSPAFSMERDAGDTELHTIWTGTPSFGGEEAPERIAGDSLLGVQLPDSLEMIGDYAFYNCRKMKSLSLSGGVRQIGGSAFMNCRSLSHITLDTDSKKVGVLIDLLGELQQKLWVTVHYRQEENKNTVKLIFPEYFEEFIENGPARIFEHFYRGSGCHYRQCFQKSELEYWEYDSRFSLAEVEDSPETLVDMALLRLQYPHELSEEARGAYLAYLTEHIKVCVEFLLRGDDFPRLEFLASLGIFTQESVAEAIASASRMKRPEALSFLMDYRNAHFSRVEKSFDL